MQGQTHRGTTREGKTARVAAVAAAIERAGVAVAAASPVRPFPLRHPRGADQVAAALVAGGGREVE